MIIGEILLMHVRDDLWTGEDIEIIGLRSIGRSVVSSTAG